MAQSRIRFPLPVPRSSHLLARSRARGRRGAHTNARGKRAGNPCNRCHRQTSRAVSQDAGRVSGTKQRAIRNLSVRRVFQSGNRSLDAGGVASTIAGSSPRRTAGWRLASFVALLDDKSPRGCHVSSCHRVETSYQTRGILLPTKQASFPFFSPGHSITPRL